MLELQVHWPSVNAAHISNTPVAEVHDEDAEELLQQQSATPVVSAIVS
jgi:hypothetical protein